jgi:hypothetical protein
MPRTPPLRSLCAALVSLTVFGFSATAGATIVSTIEPFSATPTPGVWYESDTRAGGTVGIADLTGMGGPLENTAPLPVGAALVTTGMDNADKAEIGLNDAFGTPNNILSSFSMSYRYFKATVSGGNAAAAPSVKIAFWNAAYDVVDGQDGFVQLVYEPYANLGSNPTPDVWTLASIDENTGVFWATGGFGQASSAGGPPYRTLAEWKTVFASEFGDAEMTQIAIGVGTYNQGQEGYIDQVEISHSSGGGYSGSFDFDMVPPVPMSSPWGVALMASVLLMTGWFALRGQRLSPLKLDRR